MRLLSLLPPPSPSGRPAGRPSSIPHFPKDTASARTALHLATGTESSGAAAAVASGLDVLGDICSKKTLRPSSVLAEADTSEN